jgi:hypothetical protein
VSSRATQGPQDVRSVWEELRLQSRHGFQLFAAAGIDTGLGPVVQFSSSLLGLHTRAPYLKPTELCFTFTCGALVAGKPTPAGKQQPKPAGLTAAAAGANTSALSGAGGFWRLSDILARPDEFRRVLSREVLSGKQVVMAGVVMLEAPVDAVRLQVRTCQCWQAKHAADFAPNPATSRHPSNPATSRTPSGRACHTATS